MTDVLIPSRVQACVVRDSREDDLPSVHALYAHHVRHGTASFELEPPTPAELARRRAAVLADCYPWLVAEGEDGRVLGYAYASPFRPRPAYRHTAEDSIYVAPGAIGTGVGKRLLLALLDRCEARGCRQMVAVIGDSANAASIALHAACGFRMAGLVRSAGWKFGRWLDMVMMQRELGEGDRGPPQ
jgi:L-amino acid N-acyltransferase YncA